MEPSLMYMLVQSETCMAPKTTPWAKVQEMGYMTKDKIQLVDWPDVPIPYSHDPIPDSLSPIPPHPIWSGTSTGLIAFPCQHVVARAVQIMSFWQVDCLNKVRANEVIPLPIQRFNDSRCSSSSSSASPCQHVLGPVTNSFWQVYGIQGKVF